MIAFLILSGVSIFVIVFLKMKHLSKWQAIGTAICLPLLTSFIYLMIGNPTALDPNATKAHASAGSISTQANQIAQAVQESGLTTDQIQDAIKKLEAEIANEPNNLEKLNLLANSYLISGDYVNGSLTLEKLILLGQNDVDTLLKTAESLSRAGDASKLPRINALIDTAIAQAPNNPKALWLAGMAAMQQGKLSQALSYLNSLEPMLAGTPQQAQIQQIISDIAAENNAISSEKNINTQSANNQNNTQNNTQADTQQTAGKSIKVTIALDDSIKDSTDKNHAVFIFVRAFSEDTPVPPLPLAAKKLTVADLPTTITLDANDAMVPNMNIDAFEQLEVTAKVSVSGDPANRTGDINSNAVTLSGTPDETGYNLIIKP
jgi:cytochrome c-type biogenesis protein CcmH/NrfG